MSASRRSKQSTKKDEENNNTGSEIFHERDNGDIVLEEGDGDGIIRYGEDDSDLSPTGQQYSRLPNSSPSNSFQGDGDGDDEHFQTAQKLKQNGVNDLRAGLFDAGVLTTIFSMFLTNTTEIILHAWGKYILFSAAALANVLLSAVAFNQMRLDGGKKGSKVKFGMQALFTIPIALAVAGSLIPLAAALIPTFPTIIAPLMFSITLSVKFIYQVTAAGYYYGKSRAWEWDREENKFEDDESPNDKRARYFEMAMANAVFAASTLFAVGAILGVFLFAKAAFAPLGVIAGGIGAVYILVLMAKSLNKVDDKVIGPDNENERGQNQELVTENDRQFGYEKNSTNAITSILTAAPSPTGSPTTASQRTHQQQQYPSSSSSVSLLPQLPQGNGKMKRQNTTLSFDSTTNQSGNAELSNTPSPSSVSASSSSLTHFAPANGSNKSANGSTAKSTEVDPLHYHTTYGQRGNKPK